MTGGGLLDQTVQGPCPGRCGLAACATFAGYSSPELLVGFDDVPCLGPLVPHGGGPGAEVEELAHGALVDIEVENSDSVEGEAPSGESLLQQKVCADVGGLGGVLSSHGELTSLDGEEVAVAAGS